MHFSKRRNILVHVTGRGREGEGDRQKLICLGDSLDSNYTLSHARTITSKGVYITCSALLDGQRLVALLSTVGRRFG